MDDDSEGLAVATAAWHLVTQFIIEAALEDRDKALRFIDRALVVLQRFPDKESPTPADEGAVTLLAGLHDTIASRMPPVS